MLYTLGFFFCAYERPLVCVTFAKRNFKFQTAFHAGCWWTTRITTSSPIHVAKAHLEADDFQLGRTDYPALLRHIIVPPNHPGMQSEARSRSSKKLLHADLSSSRSKEPSRPQKSDEDSDDRSGHTATSPPLDASGLRVGHPSVCLSGGPAGSYPASVLAREGISVTVLESAKFPRYHVGESLIPSVRHYMRFIGADEKLATHGFANKVESQFLGRFTSVDAAVKQVGLWD
ncbi:hypothetical protein B0H14DRAFT_2653223 [Mycena olivaceomarginata]|nr:hypothetical protein B0H14DRAFT_2653223 [Mycena olivaceomarginata]